MLTARIAQALSMAVEAHAGQMRKGTTIPYLSHPLAVASIALEYGADEDQAIAALLHDAIEATEFGEASCFQLRPDVTPPEAVACQASQRVYQYAQI